MDLRRASAKVRTASLVLIAALAAPAAGAEEAKPAPSAPEATRAAPAAEPAATDDWAFPERGLLLFPAAPDAGKDRMAVGGLWQIAPMFTASYRRGVGSGFAIDGQLATIILFNQLTVGASWAAKAGPFHLGLTGHVGFFLGALGKAFVQTSSFDAIGWGLLTNPGAMAGLQVASNSWLTLKYEAYIAPYQAAKLGTLTLSPKSALYEGSGLTLAVEYSPAKKGVIYYGVSLYHTRSNYPIWFNVEATPSSEPYSAQMIWYLGLLAGYEF